MGWLKKTLLAGSAAIALYAWGIPKIIPLVKNKLKESSSNIELNHYKIADVFVRKKKQLGLEKKSIDIFVSLDGEKSYSEKVDDNKYLITLAYKHLNEAVLTHELCHIKLGHNDIGIESDFLHGLVRDYILEPDATLCGFLNK